MTFCLEYFIKNKILFNKNITIFNYNDWKYQIEEFCHLLI